MALQFYYGAYTVSQRDNIAFAPQREQKKSEQGKTACDIHTLYPGVLITILSRLQ